jgi:hypothetical protein
MVEKITLVLFCLIILILMSIPLFILEKNYCEKWGGQKGLQVEYKLNFNRRCFYLNNDGKLAPAF